MLWLSAIALPICIGFSLLFHDSPVIQAALILVGCLPVWAAVIGFVFFMLKSPSRLQSEDYQIKQQALELVQSKGSQIEILPIALEGISNPQQNRLAHDGGQ